MIKMDIQNIPVNISERITEIYNANSKIPFMMAKDILEYGYKYGISDYAKNNKSIVVDSKDNNNNKEPLKNDNQPSIDNIVKHKDKKNNKKQDNNSISKSEKIKIQNEAKYDMLNLILSYMNTHDYIEVYDHCKKLKYQYQPKEDEWQ